jgi:endonuclease/exonuclease/phosphatase family metal-dependent hydrolase
MRAQDRLLEPLRRQTRLLPTYPAQLNSTFQPWSLPVLPIDHLYVSTAWTTRHIARIRTPGSDHFGLETNLILSR